jgi:hypothetical protein
LLNVVAWLSPLFALGIVRIAAAPAVLVSEKLAGVVAPEVVAVTV